MNNKTKTNEVWLVLMLMGLRKILSNLRECCASPNLGPTYYTMYYENFVNL